jgi:BlaI family transcriptional regulator, penicillinase repressor
MSREVTDAELAVMDVLWDQGESTVREIADALYRKSSTTEIGTVHSLLRRLDRKKFVRCSRRTHPHRFSAKVTREDLAGREVKAIAEKLSEGSMAPLIMHLLDSGDLTREDAAEIRTLLKNYKPNQG